MRLETVTGSIDLALRNTGHEDIWKFLNTKKRLTTCLEEGANILENLLQVRADKLHAKALSKFRTMRKNEGMKLAEETFRTFSLDLRYLLSDQPAWLETLELNRSSQSKAEAQKLERWRRMMLNLQTLGPDVLQRLTEQGYPPESLDERMRLIDTVGDLRAAQIEAAGARKAQVAREKSELETAKAWLNQWKASIEEGLRGVREEQACFIREALGLKPGKAPAPKTELPQKEEDDDFLSELDLEPEVRKEETISSEKVDGSEAPVNSTEHFASKSINHKPRQFVSRLE